MPAAVPQPDSPAVTRALLDDYIRTGDIRFRNEVVARHRWLAVAIVRRMHIRSQPFDDLVQVAMIGMLKAAERFDPTFEVAFTSFAGVTVRGEIRRYYRDAGWDVHVPRRLQDLRYEIRAATDVLTDRLDRSPTTVEIAEYLHVDVDSIIDAMCADANFRSRSLDDRAGEDRTIGEALGRPDGGFEMVDGSDAFDELCGHLSPRSAQIVRLRYVRNMKQSEIAAAVGISQVHVSRLLEQAHERLRAMLSARDDDVSVRRTRHDRSVTPL